MATHNVTNNDDEPIIQTVAEPLQQILQQKAESSAPQQTKPKAAKTRLFAPSGRQPLARLTILDDGSRRKGEIIRIRDSRIVIGRERGHVTIPCDGDMSGQHAELRCQPRDGRFHWYLIDMNSTNGTFLRAYRASLSRQAELILGSRRYQFRLPENAAPDDHDDSAEALETHRYEAPAGTLLEQYLPRLMEVGTRDAARSFNLGKTKVVFGRDARCDIAITDDPLISPQHARFYQDERKRWMVDDTKSLNGVWMRIRRIALSHAAEFQLGQQRFRFQPGPL